jgi:hypothetical protein
LTKDFRDTVQARSARDTAFRVAMFQEAMQACRMAMSMAATWRCGPTSMQRSDLRSSARRSDQGIMDPEILYEPPFTGIAPTGPEHLFDEAKVTQLFTKIRALNDDSAVA